MIYRISYAYPSSPDAERMGRGKTGCYLLESGQTARAFPTFHDACRAANGLSAAPVADCMSMDHPANARFLPDIFPVCW